MGGKKGIDQNLSARKQGEVRRRGDGCKHHLREEGTQKLGKIERKAGRFATKAQGKIKSGITRRKVWDFHEDPALRNLKQR